MDGDEKDGREPCKQEKDLVVGLSWGPKIVSHWEWVDQRRVMGDSRKRRCLDLQERSAGEVWQHFQHTRGL